MSRTKLQYNNATEYKNRRTTLKYVKDNPLEKLELCKQDIKD